MRAKSSKANAPPNRLDVLEKEIAPDGRDCEWRGAGELQAAIDRAEMKWRAAESGRVWSAAVEAFRNAAPVGQSYIAAKSFSD